MGKALLARVMAMVLTFTMILTALPSAAVDALAAEAMYYGIYTGTVTWSQLYGNNNFDVITSATTNKSGMVTNGVTETTADGTGTNYIGVTNVPVAVDTTVYQSLTEEQKALITLNEDQTQIPAWYLTIGADGTVDGQGMTTTSVTNVDVSAEIEAPSAWGDYCVMMTEEEQKYLPEASRGGAAGLISFDNLLGGTFTAVKDGVETTYTLGYMENLWTRTYEFSFRIAEDSSMVHMGNSTNYKQFENIEGSEIKSVTYYTTDGAYQFNLTSGDAKVKNQIPESAQITGDSEVTISADGSLSVQMDSSNLPDGFALESVGRSNGHGNTLAAEGTYTYENGVLTISAAEVAELGGAGTYEAVFTDTSGTYVNAEYSFTVNKASTKISIKSSVTYTGKAVTGLATVKGSTGEVTYTYYSDSKGEKEISAPKKVGTYYVKVSVAADNCYKAKTSKITKFKIKKAKPTITIKTTSKSYKAATVKKASKSFSIGAAVNSKGKFFYKKVSGSSKLTISKTTGKVTVKKGTKKGTYKIKVKIASKATSNYTSGSKTKTIKVVIK